MQANAIDKYIVAECVKQEVDKVYKDAKQDAEDELARLRDENGSLSATSKLFGPEAGEFKYAMTKKKVQVDWNLADVGEFYEWCNANADALIAYVERHATDFGKWWFESTGEPVDGISRVEYDVPAGLGKPKIYRLDPDAVKAKLQGGLLEGGASLLLGESDE